MKTMFLALTIFSLNVSANTFHDESIALYSTPVSDQIINLIDGSLVYSEKNSFIFDEVISYECNETDDTTFNQTECSLSVKNKEPLVLQSAMAYVLSSRLQGISKRSGLENTLSIEDVLSGDARFVCRQEAPPLVSSKFSWCEIFIIIK